MFFIRKQKFRTFLEKKCYKEEDIALFEGFLKYDKTLVDCVVLVGTEEFLCKPETIKYIKDNGLTICSWFFQTLAAEGINFISLFLESGNAWIPFNTTQSANFMIIGHPEENLRILNFRDAWQQYCKG